MKRNKTPAAEVCTTQKAAELLGISVTTVQHLAEAGIIEAWKTEGGHRRIPLAAVEAYKASPTAASGTPAAAGSDANRKTAILVIEDNKMQRQIYEKQFASWNLPMDVAFCENGYRALIEIASHKPDILLADIVMDGIDGYEVVKTILSHPDLGDVHVAIASGLGAGELQARGGVPDGVVFFPKPINYDELRGYIRACCAQRQRTLIRK